MLLAFVALALVACGGEEPRSSGAAPQPAGNTEEQRVEKLGVCSTRRFELALREGSVSVTGAGTELAFASYEEREVLPACTPNTRQIRMTPRRIKEVARLYSDKELGELIREPTTVTCAAPAPVELSVHPVWDERGDIIGSGLAVAAKVKGTLELLATAGLKPGGEALQYAARYCQPA